MRDSELLHLDALLIDGRSGAGKTDLAARVLDRLRAMGCSPQLLSVEHLYPGWDGLAEGSRALAAALDTGEYPRYDWVAGAFAERVELPLLGPLIIEGCGALTAENLAAARRWSARLRDPLAPDASASPASSCPAPDPTPCPTPSATSASRNHLSVSGADPEALPLKLTTRSAATAATVATAAVGAGAGEGEAGGRVRSVWIECDAAVRRARALARDGETYAPHWERWAAQEEAFFAEHRPWLLADEVLHC
ncbi:MAG: hypothetical protein QM606_06365 [Leucobacter sp.]